MPAFASLLRDLPRADDAANWPTDDHEGWRHADAWAEVVPPGAGAAEHIAAAAGLDATLAQTLDARARLLAVLYRQPELDDGGNLLGVQVASEPWPGAHEVTSELLAVDRTDHGLRALHWEWAEERGAGTEALLVSSVAAVTVAPEALSSTYRLDPQWPTQSLWKAHAERSALYRQRADGQLAARPALTEHLRGLAARYLALTAQEPAALPKAEPHAASLRDALWQPRRLGGFSGDDR